MFVYSNLLNGPNSNFLVQNRNKIAILLYLEAYYIRCLHGQWTVKTNTLRLEANRELGLFGIWNRLARKSSLSDMPCQLENPS